MKKIGLTALAIGAMIFSVESASAQVTENTPTQEQMAQAEQDWQSIEESDLPEKVQAAFERDFEGASISEAYVKDEKGVKTYKLVVATEDDQTKDLYADAEGNWLDNQK